MSVCVEVGSCVEPLVELMSVCVCFLKKCLSLSERCSLSRSGLISQGLRLPGVGQKFKPLDSRLICGGVSSREDILITPLILIMESALPE